jgi:hypothetical protein
LFIGAKDLFVEAKAPRPSTKTFEIDQNVEPIARTRRPTAVGAALNMREASIMSDEFDGLDATEKAGVEAALNRCRTLAAQIESKLRNKRPDFVDKSWLADLYASLELAAGVLARPPLSTDDIN